MLGAVVLAAVASVVTEQWFLGDEPLFHVPPYHLVHGAAPAAGLEVDQPGRSCSPTRRWA